MGKGNLNNLVQNKEQTPEERRMNAQKAGVASGKSRREKKLIQQALFKALSGKYKVGNPEKEDCKVLGGYDAIAVSMITEAINGNVKAATFVRDSIGEKPTDKVELESSENAKLLNTYMESLKNGKE